jgi:hypothetical protein
MMHDCEEEDFGPDYLVTEFDEKRRILHISYRRKIHPVTDAHVEMKFRALRRILDRLTRSGRVYLIIDMSNFILEPELKAFYGEQARRIRDLYIMPNGIARYGFQITRITVRRGYAEYLGEDPNIFNSREEAFAYIYALIEEHKRAGIGIPAATFAGNSGTD